MNMGRKERGGEEVMMHWGRVLGMVRGRVYISFANAPLWSSPGGIVANTLGVTANLGSPADAAAAPAAPAAAASASAAAAAAAEPSGRATFFRGELVRRSEAACGNCCGNCVAAVVAAAGAGTELCPKTSLIPNWNP